MHLLAREVLGRGVRSKLGTALLATPTGDRFDHEARDTLAAVRRSRVDPFEESDGRGLAAIHIVVPKCAFDEANSFAGIVTSDEGDGVTWIGEQA